MKKRGQASMEFMMTYGWALLGVLVVFSALYYYFTFGGPNTCNIDQPFTCVDLKGDSVTNQVTLVISSSDVDTVTALSDLTFTGKSFVCTKEAGAIAKLDDADLYQQVINFPCGSNLGEGDTLQGEFTITYARAGGLDHVASGNFYVNIE